MTTFDVARARAETPGVQHVVHFNNAGAGLMPACVLDAQQQHLQLEARIGGYEAHDRELSRVEGVYDSIAQLIGASREEIAIVENATVGWDMAFYAFQFQPGDRILTAQAEYGANFIAYLQVAERRGVKIDVIPSDESGATSAAALAAMIDDRVKLISISHVPTNGGLVNPAAEIGAVARQHGIPFLLDACQSTGQLALDVEELGCDLLSATGRKFLRGPRGVGFLYVRNATLKSLEPPILDHHAANWVAADRYEIRADARRFENWEFNYAATLGLGAAVDYALDWGMKEIESRVYALGDQLRSLLNELPGVRTYDLGAKPCGIVTFTVDGMTPKEIKMAVGSQSFNVSASSPASTLIDAQTRSLPELVRASVHYYNDEDEVDNFVAAIHALSSR